MRLGCGLVLRARNKGRCLVLVSERKRKGKGEEEMSRWRKSVVVFLYTYLVSFFKLATEQVRDWDGWKLAHATGCKSERN